MKANNTSKPKWPRYSLRSGKQGMKRIELGTLALGAYLIGSTDFLELFSCSRFLVHIGMVLHIKFITGSEVV